MHTVTGDAGNLELSFSLVDALASAVETLGLARSSDIPDPFRRVWVFNEDGARKRGVVLRCEGDEVAVFCPPSQDRFTSTGDMMKLSYRGFSSSVEYNLRLNDAVRLPEALVLHLTRPDGEGAIGRDDIRREVRLAGQVCVQGGGESGEQVDPIACQVLDVSTGGLRIASDLRHGLGQEVEIELGLPGDHEGLIWMRARICWNRSDDSGKRTQGLQFFERSTSAYARYERFLQALQPSDRDSFSGGSTGTTEPGIARPNRFDEPAHPAEGQASPAFDNEPLRENNVHAASPVSGLETELELTASLLAQDGAQCAPDSGAHSLPEIEGLRADLRERQAEIARLSERIGELQTDLDATASPAELDEGSIEEIPSRALGELEELQAVEPVEFSDWGSDMPSTLSMFESLNVLLDELEGLLSEDKLSEIVGDGRE